MERFKFQASTAGRKTAGLLSSFLFSVLLLLAAGAAVPSLVAAQTEFGSEDDITVLGVDGTADDPDAEIKGFTVFGSTQTAYPGAVVGSGNVVVNGVLAVSSGAYFVGNSTFTGAGKIFVNDGAPGQVLRKNAAGYLDWDSVTALGDNLGDHTATQVLKMGAYGVNSSSSITAARFQINGSTMLAILPGVESIAVGPNIAAHNTGNYNVFVGSGAAAANTTGAQGTFIGHSAGYANTTGAQNTFVGYAAGYKNLGGWYNTFLGVNAGYNNASGQYNTYLGDGAGLANTTGSNNSYLGYYAGSNGQTGGGNIVIGSGQGLSAPSANDELNLGGVLYGDLAAKTVGISTRVPQAALDVVSTGTAHTDMAQLWRDSGGVIKGSMSATGVMTATKFIGDGAGITGLPGGDNLGDHIATTTLQMGVYGINTSSNITAARYQINGSTVLALSGNSANPVSSIGLGPNAGMVNTGNFNVFIGSATGATNTIGVSNTMVGTGAGKMNVNGNSNAFMGRNAGFNNVSGASNIYVGTNAGYYSQTGSANVVLGPLAGQGVSGSSFSSSTLVGYQAGYNLGSGSNNIIIGYGQGAPAADTSDFMNVGGVIYGDLANHYVGIGTGTPTALLDVYGRTVMRGISGGDGFGQLILGDADNRGGLTLWNGSSEQLGYLRFETAGSNLLTLGSAGGSGQLGFATGGGEQMRITAAGNVGISTSAPQARLDVLAGGSTADAMATIWRDSTGAIVSSVSATGVMMATKFIGDGSGLAGIIATGDNLGNHVATMPLTANYGIAASSMILNASGVTGSDTVFQVAGSTMVVLNNGNVGIGTTAPTKELEVSVNSTASPIAGALRGIVLVNRDLTANSIHGILFSAYDDGGLGRHSGAIVGGKESNWISASGNYPGSLSFWTRPAGGDETERMRITSTGNVGIGTTAPAQKLDIAGNGNIRLNNYTALGSQYSSGATVLGNNVGVDTASVNQMVNLMTNGTYAGSAIQLVGSDGITFHTKTGAATAGAVFSSPVMKITAAGNVGIGTTAPGATLHISGRGQDTSSISNAGAMGGTMIIADPAQNANSGGTLLFSGETGTTWFSGMKGLLTNGVGYTIGDLAFMTRNATGDATLSERMRIMAGGNVGIGATNPGEKLEVSGNIKLSGATPTYKITNVANPTANSDVATKGYVDAAGTRKFYLTVGTYQGNATLTACAAGYHFASFWEILNVSALKYDTSLGYAVGDSGSGPPSAVIGWVRGSTTHCLDWTTNSAGLYGVSVTLPSYPWTAATLVSSPWNAAGNQACVLYNRVWCVSD